MLAPALAQNVDLSAPVSRTPTVMSEIKRGHGDAIRCVEKYSTPDTIGTPDAIRQFWLCVDGEQRVNISGSTISDPYLFGLYITGNFG